MREKIITGATGWIGTSENPKGSNKTPFGEWYDLNGVAWCAIFVSYIYHFAGCTLPTDIEKPSGKWFGFHYVPNLLRWATKNNKLTNDPKLGDIFIIDFQGDYFFDHTGIFVEWVDASKTKFKTIEGNTSSDHKGSQDNGDGVYSRIRSVKNSKFINVID